MFNITDCFLVRLTISVSYENKHLKCALCHIPDILLSKLMDCACSEASRGWVFRLGATRGDHLNGYTHSND